MDFLPFNRALILNAEFALDISYRDIGMARLVVVVEYPRLEVNPCMSLLSAKLSGGEGAAPNLKIRAEYGPRALEGRIVKNDQSSPAPGRCTVPRGQQQG